jgi:hypothetical protein
MMAKMAYTPSAAAKPPGPQAPPPGASELSEEDKSKDAFFVQLAEIAEAMIAKHGKDFAMGTLILSARFIAENKPLIKQTAGARTQ